MTAIVNTFIVRNKETGKIKYQSKRGSKKDSLAITDPKSVSPNLSDAVRELPGWSGQLSDWEKNMNNRAKNLLVSNYENQDIDLLMVDLLNRLDDKEAFDIDGNFTPEALIVVLEGFLCEKRGRDLAIRNRVYEVAEKMLCRFMSEEAALFDQTLYQITEPTLSVLSVTGSAVSKERIEALVEVSCLDLFGHIN